MLVRGKINPTTFAYERKGGEGRETGAREGAEKVQAIHLAAGRKEGDSAALSEEHLLLPPEQAAAL